MKKILLSASLAIAFCLLIASFAGAQSLGYMVDGGILPNAPDYDWWYGCSPTSAGMMMGYYDISHYGGLYYPNLVPGGAAELSNYGNPGARANQVIASDEHIADFWGYPDPLLSGRTIPDDFNSLADFMGTSQAALGRGDGSTGFWYYTDGSQLSAYDIYSYGSYYYDRSGMYGLWEYEQYAGYGAGIVNDQMIYNQLIPGGAIYLGYPSNPDGFSWLDYMNEINAGRPVLIHVEGHTMFGYGYDAQTNDVLLHNTWWAGEERMTWGGDYFGLGHYGVTVFEPTGGIIPEPGTYLLFGSGLLALGFFRKIRKKKRVKE